MTAPRRHEVAPGCHVVSTAGTSRSGAAMARAAEDIARGPRVRVVQPRTKDHPDVIAAWRHMVEAARAFARCADEFSDDIGATAEHYDALERAQERLARAWDGEPVAPAWQMPKGGAL